MIPMIRIGGNGISARNANVRSTPGTSYRYISMTALTISTRYTTTIASSTNRTDITTLRFPDTVEGMSYMIGS